jgi:isoquinoline 1-oxidoreductase beta subunit
MPSGAAHQTPPAAAGPPRDEPGRRQSNFHDYRVLRISDMPEIHTRIVESGAAPTGMGEIGVVTVAPAIANAVFELTGKRLRHLPMTPARVKRVLT